MLRNLGAAAALAALFYSPAAAAAVPAEKCNYCTGAQEEQLALSTPGLGVRFVYDLPQHTIRKFAVYLDVPGRFVTDAVPVEPQPTHGARVQTSSGVALRTLYEMSVDPDVLSVFGEMDSLYASNPQAFSKVHRVEISRVGLTSGDLGPRRYDPRAIAWEYPGGEALQFLDRLGDVFASPPDTEFLDRTLYRLIHGIGIPASGAYIEGGSGGGTVGANFSDVSREITVDFCNQEGGCTRVKLTISSQGVRAEIVGSRDAQNVPYPQMSERPLRREWGRNGFESACDMASFVTGRSGGNYTVTGGPVC